MAAWNKLNKSHQAFASPVILVGGMSSLRYRSLWLKIIVKSNQHLRFLKKKKEDTFISGKTVENRFRFHFMFCYYSCFSVCDTEGRNRTNQKYARQTQASAPAPLQLMSTTSFAPRRTMTWFLLAHTPKTPPSYALPLTHQQVTMTTWGVGTRRVASWRLPVPRAVSSTSTLMTSALGVVAPSTTPAWAAQERGTWTAAARVAAGTESFMTGV